VLKGKLAARRTDGRGGGARAYPILTRRATLAEPSDDGAAFAREAKRLLLKTPAVPIRLVGVGATNLVPIAAAQLALFEPTGERRKAVRLNRALDEIVERYGDRAVVRAGQEAARRAALTLQRKRGERDADAGDAPASKR
jgi:hypothetical protein